MSVTYHPLTPDHAADYIRLRKISLETDPDAFGTTREEADKLTVEELRGIMEKTLTNGGWYIGAFDGETLIGNVIVMRETGQKRRHVAWVLGVYVSLAYRGRGVGGEMIRHVIEWAGAQDGLAVLSLSVAAQNDAARRIYERYGFTIWGTEPRFFKTEMGYFDEHHMSLLL